MGDVVELGWGFGDGGEGVTEHGVAEGAGGAYGGGPGTGEFLSADVADAVAVFFAEEGKSAAGTAAEAAFVAAWGFDERAGEGDDLAGLLVDVTIAAEVAGVVVDNVATFRLFREAVFVAGHELGVVLDLGGDAVLAPVV